MSTDKRMAIKPALNQFNGGEISPYLEGRYDWDKYNYSAKLCQNFIPTVEGYLKRRGGTHFVNTGVYRPPVKLDFNFLLDGDNIVPVKLIVNDVEYILEASFFPSVSKSLSFMRGETVIYSVVAEGYVPITSSLVVESDTVISETLILLENAVTLTINPSPSASIVKINGIITKSLTVEKDSTINYSVSYSHTEVSNTTSISVDTTLNITVPYTVFKSNTPQLETVSVERALYTIYIVGGGAGGGGGASDKNARETGRGGGGGACFCGVAELSGVLRLKVGQKGYGGNFSGQAGTSGTSGEESYISDLIVAGGGKGGDGAHRGYTGGGGGTLTVNTTVSSYSISSNGHSCNHNVGGSSLYNGHGRGGYGGYGYNNGEDGTNGYIEIKYYGEV